MTAVRDEVQTGYAEYHEVNRRPLAASRSSAGVFVVGCPVKPRSP